MRYKVLSLTQPWATLIAIHAKKIETRSWATSYRGQLLIHAAKGFGPGGARAHKALCGTEPFCSVLNAEGKRWLAQRGDLADMVAHPLMPMGAIIATCELVDCVDAAHWAHYHGIQALERAFGDYTDGRFAWLLEGVRALPTPIAARGKLGLWTWEGTL